MAGESLGAALAWAVVANVFFAGVASVTVTGRITFALARDGAFPGSHVLATAHPTLKCVLEKRCSQNQGARAVKACAVRVRFSRSPVNAILFVFVVDALLLLLPLVPDNGLTAFYSIINLSTLGFQISSVSSSRSHSEDASQKKEREKEPQAD